MILLEKGVLKTFSGDSYEITFNIKGLEPVALYQIYFQINYPTPLVKKSEITTDNDGNCKISFSIEASENCRTGNFTYGVKACRDNQEDTIKTGIINVCSLAVEGTVNE